MEHSAACMAAPFRQHISVLHGLGWSGMAAINNDFAASLFCVGRGYAPFRLALAALFLVGQPPAFCGGGDLGRAADRRRISRLPQDRGEALAGICAVALLRPEPL